MLCESTEPHEGHRINESWSGDKLVSWDWCSGTWTMPAWMEPYRELIGNTGGNSIEELYNDRTTAQQNLIRAALALSVRDQVNILYRLHRKGWLVNLDDPALCGYCLHHADLHTYNGHRAAPAGVVPCVQCPGGICPRPMPPERTSAAR